MKLLKLRRLVSLVTCFSLVLQSFLPFTLALPAYAVDEVATDSGTVVEAPTPEVTPEPTVTPVITVTPEAIPASTDSAALVVTSENLIDTNSSNSDLLINPEENSITFDNVSAGTTYTSKDGKATVTFTEITGPSGELTIKEITLTAEQVAEAGAVSEKAYDITSSMIDGTFKFDLTLPKPESGNIEVKFSEDGKDFVTSGGVSTTENEVVVTDVNHFTIFVVVYYALPSVTNTNHASLGFQATQTSEFGDYIHLGGSNRLLNSVTVTMSNWAKYSTYSSDSRYSGNSSTWSHPITINIYGAQLKADGTPSTKLGTVTQNITIPWRPESSSECGTAWKSSDGNCYNGIAFNAVFDMSSLNLTLPDDIIVGVAYNTNTYGQSPIGSHGPYESLNVAVPEDQTVSVGSDDSVSEVFWNTVTKAWYTDGGAAGFGVFRNDTNWSPNGTVAFKIDTIDNTPPVISIGNGNGNLNSGPVDGQAYSGNVDVYASLSDINLYNYHLRVIKDGSVDSHNCGNTLGNSENQGYGKCGYVYNQITSQTTNVDDEIISSLDTTQFGGDGTYWLILGAIDSVGNRAAPNYQNDPRVKIVIDNTIPTATIDGVAPKSLYNGSTSISVHAIDNNYLQTDLYLNNATVPFKTYNGAWFGLFWLSDGNYRMVVRDKAENSTEYSFIIDKTAPATPILESPEDNIYRSTSSSNYSDWSDVTDTSGVVYRYQSASDVDFSNLYYDSSVNHVGPLTNSMIMNPGEPEVSYYWRVQACDTLGNCSAWSPARRINIDNSAPTKPVFTSPADSTITKINNVTVNWTGGDDAGSGVKGYIFRYVFSPANGGAPINWTSGLVASTSKTRSGTYGHGEGRYTMYVKTVDNLGHESIESDPLNIIFDSSAPTFIANISFLPASPTNNNNVVWSWNAAEEKVVSSGLKQYNWSLLKFGILQTSGSTAGTSLSMTLSADGEYNLEVTAEDNVGNISAINTSLDFILDRVAPTASFKHFIDGNEFSGTVARVNNLGQLSFTGNYLDADPSSGLKQDSFVIFQAQDNGTFAFSANGKQAYCGWRTGANTMPISGTSDTLDNISFTNCVADLPEGEYYMSHQVYDNAIRQDIPSITQFRDVLGLHFIVDKTAPVTTISSPSDSQFFNGAINIGGNTKDVSGVAKVVLSFADFDGTVCGDYSLIETLTPDVATTDYTWSYSWTPSAQGSYCIKAAGTDSVGNEEHSAIVSNITYDTVLPEVTLGETPTDGLLTNENDQTFSASVSEPVASCTLNIVGNGTGNYSERQISNGLSDGSGYSYVIGGDDWATYYGLPFNFNFYGNSYSNVSVSTNGLLRFNSPYADSSLSDSVSNLQQRIAIAPLWDDIVTNVYVQNNSDNIRFRWNGYGWSTGGYLTTEAVLRSNGTVELHYGDVYLPSRAFTAGLSSGTGESVLSSVNGSTTVSPVSYSYSPGATSSYLMNNDGEGKYSVTVPDIADGIISYSVTCVDPATNEGVSDSRTMTVDTQAPALTEKTSFEGWFNEDQTSEFIYSDENGIASGTPVTCVISTEGENQVCSVTPNVCDNAGNCNTEEVTSNGANIDKTNPVVSLTFNPVTPELDNGWYQTQPEITINVVDANPELTQYQWDGTQDGDWLTYSAPIKPATEGTHTLYFRAFDKASNGSGTSSSIVKWDQTEIDFAPKNIQANPNPTSGTTSKITWEAAGDNVGVNRYEIKWTLNDTTTPTSYSKSVASEVRETEIDQLTEGRWTVSVRAFDSAGHNKDAAIDLFVDRTAPVAPTLVLGATGEGTVDLSWNAIDDAKDYIIWYGTTPGGRLYGARVGLTTSYTVRGLGAGNYYFIVRSVDGAQNQSAESNEVNTGTIIGAPGVVEGTPAEGFTPEVQGINTDVTPTPESSILGITTNGDFNWWWLLLLLVIPLYIGVRKATKKH